MVELELLWTVPSLPAYRAPPWLLSVERLAGRSQDAFSRSGVTLRVHLRSVSAQVAYVLLLGLLGRPTSWSVVSSERSGPLPSASVYALGWGLLEPGPPSPPPEVSHVRPLGQIGEGQGWVEKRAWRYTCDVRAESRDAAWRVMERWLGERLVRRLAFDIPEVREETERATKRAMQELKQKQIARAKYWAKRRRTQ